MKETVGSVAAEYGTVVFFVRSWGSMQGRSRVLEAETLLILLRLIFWKGFIFDKVDQGVFEEPEGGMDRLFACVLPVDVICWEKQHRVGWPKQLAYRQVIEGSP